MKFLSLMVAVTLAAAGIWSTPASTSAPIPEVQVKRDRALFIYGPMVYTNISVPGFFAQADRIQSDPSTSPVFVVISSEGGDIEVGKAMQYRVNLLKAKGINVICAVVDSSQSAAFYMMVTCSRRVTLKSAKFMMHQIRWAISGAVLNSGQLTKAAAELDLVNNYTLQELIGSMKPPKPTQFKEDFFATKEWTGEQLAKEFPNWIQMVDTIIYID